MTDASTQQSATSPHPEDLWHELAATATLGTARRGFVLPQAEGKLGSILARLDPSDQEGTLLSAASTLALYRLTGIVAQKMPQTNAALLSNAQDRPECSPEAVQHLRTILSGGQPRPLLFEWLEALNTAGLRVASAELPELLDYGRSHGNLQALIRAAIGLRGAWLVEHNPDWAYAKSTELVGQGAEHASFQLDELNAQWETGSHPARLALLEALRPLDPAAARTLIEATWASERADERAAFVAQLAQGLSIADEPFLEAALNDRSKEVRRTAAGLLIRLPQSQLVGRITERLAPLLQWNPGESAKLLSFKRSRPAQLHVTLPVECDKNMQRDGIEAKVPSQHRLLGERAWWLMQMLSAVPPVTWSARWEASPAQIVAVLQGHEWRAPLLGGWVSAILTHGDAEWAEALLRVEPDHPELMDALPAAQQEALLLEKLRSKAAIDQHPLLTMLRRYPRPWSLELARAFLRALYRHMTSWTQSNDWALVHALQHEFALRIPPELMGEIADDWPRGKAGTDRWQTAVEGLLSTLQFRQHMLRALRP